MSRLPPNKVIVIGASTGGPGHIRRIMASLDGTMEAAVVVAQHMDAVYLPSFAKQMQELSALEVRLVEERSLLERGHVYVCSGSSVFKETSEGVAIEREQGCEGHYNPNIDRLFDTAAEVTKSVGVLGIILTGIGEDGARGCLHLAEAGGYCIAESETSAVVYGMPKRAYELNRQIDVKALDAIIATIHAFGGR